MKGQCYKVLVILMVAILDIQPSLVWALSSNTSTIDCIPKSPEAAAFDRITDIPVSMYTGTMNFSIPLYTITSGDLSLPISLDYQGSAIRVEQEATWVGLNWLLNAGGVITTRMAQHSSRTNSADDYMLAWERSLNSISLAGSGFYDGGEFQVPYKFEPFQPMVGNKGGNWFKQLSAIIDNGMNVSESSSDLPKTVYSDILDFHNGEAPMYHAVFLGNSFKFVYDKFDDDFKIVGTKKNFKIEGSYSNAITITDGKGIKYYFYLIEKTFPSGSSVDNGHMVFDGTFYLQKIESPSGNTIFLDYIDEGHYWPTRHVIESLYDRNYPSKIPMGIANTDVHLDIIENCTLVRSITPYYEVNKKRLSRIRTDSITVYFDAITDREDLNVGLNSVGNWSRSHIKRLDDIRIVKHEDGEEKQLRKFIFNYGYFEKNTCGGNTLKDYWRDAATIDVYSDYYPNDDFIYKRLRLDKLQEVGSDNSTKPAYKFNYYGDLPGKNSAAQDYWGYYNGQENNNGRYHTLLPMSLSKTDDNAYLMNNLTGNCGNRTSDIRYLIGGMLSSVTYPTGATASFKYEQNTFDNFTYQTNLNRYKVDYYDGILNCHYDATILSKQPESRKNSHNIMAYSSNQKGYGNPTGGKNFSSFELKNDCSCKISALFTKQSMSSSSNDYWRYFMETSIVLNRFEINDNGVEVLCETKPFFINGEDTVGASSQIIKEYEMLLPKGRYEIRVPTPVGFNNSTYAYEELKVTNKSSEYSNPVSNIIIAYNTNQGANYSRPEIPSTRRGKHYFLVEEAGFCHIKAKYDKSDLTVRSDWAMFYRRQPLKLYNYVNADGMYNCNVVKSFSINALDTLSARYALEYEDTIWLEKGMYALCTPSLSDVPNSAVFLEEEISACMVPGKVSASQGAGLRIAEIMKKDGGSQSITTYSYNDDNGKTTGLLMAPVRLAREKTLIYQHENSVSPNGTVPTPSKIDYIVKSSENLTPNTSQVCYSKVTEKHFSGNAHARTLVYEFWNRRWGYGTMWDYMKRIDDPRNGNIVKMTIYDANMGLKSTETNSYKISKSWCKPLSIVAENLYSGPNYALSLNAISSYNPWQEALTCGIMDLHIYPSCQFEVIRRTQTTVIKEKDGDIAETKTTEFNTENCMPAKEIVNTSKNHENKVVEYLYPTDYSETSSVHGLVDAHITEVPTQIITSIVRNDSECITSSNLMEYDEQGHLIGMYARKLGNSISKNSFELSNSNDFDMENYYTLQTVAYDNTVTPSVVRMTTDKSNISTIYIWGYSHRYPIAAVTGVSLQEIVEKLPIPLVDLEDSAIPCLTARQLYDILSTIQGSLVTTYSYDPYIGMISSIVPNGMETNYQYDGLQRLKLVSDSLGKKKEIEYNYQNK